MSYEPVKKAMQAGTPLELICAACPWDRLCITPPSMTSADIEEAMNKAEANDARPGEKGARLLMTALIMAGRDTQAQVCPVFAVRLKSPEGRQLADMIRSSMQAGEPR